jgi:hypothetical protein
VWENLGKSGGFLLSTYEIWKVLVSLAKQNFFFIANFHVLYLKNEFRAKKIFRLSRGVAGVAVGG